MKVHRFLQPWHEMKAAGELKEKNVGSMLFRHCSRKKVKGLSLKLVAFELKSNSLFFLSSQQSGSDSMTLKVSLNRSSFHSAQIPTNSPTRVSTEFFCVPLVFVCFSGNN